jgi:hypothetical protein
MFVSASTSCSKLPVGCVAGDCETGAFGHLGGGTEGGGAARGGGCRGGAS